MATDLTKARPWSELPKEEQIHGCYWTAIPKDPDTHLDGWDFEVVYVYFDGKWSVFRMGQNKRENLDDFLFIDRLKL